jgi:EpsD family peptidyl-prolyl cis-trans isomerase
VAPGQKPDAERAALERIVERKLMAQQAVKLGLDKAPDFDIRLQRARDSLLAAAAQKQRQAALAKPQRAAAEAYVRDHPTAFAGRKVMVIDQIRLPRPDKPLPPVKDLKSLDELTATFDQAGIGYSRGLILFDSLTADPRIVERLSGLPAGAVFETDQDGLVLVNQIIQTRSLPLTGEGAVQAALEILSARQQQDDLAKQLADLRRDAGTKLVYSQGYAPPPK